MRYFFWSVATFWTASEALASCSQQVPCFDVCSVRPPQIFPVQAKISTVRPVFPNYISVSYDYAFISYLHSLTEIKILLSCGRLLKKKNLSKITYNLPLYSELHCWRLFLSKYEKVLYMFWKVLSEWHLCMCLVYCSWPKFNWVNLK